MYFFLKALLDPVVLLLGVLAVTAVRMRKKDSRALTRGCLTAFLILYGSSLPLLADALCYVLERDTYGTPQVERGSVDVVVVLAGGVAGNTALEAHLLNRQSAIRLVRGVEVFGQTGARYLVCAGATEGFDEAGVMAESARRLGVPPQSVRTDSASRNTREHAEQLSKLFDGRVTKIGLVTSAYHVPRSSREFRKYFANVVVFPTDYLNSFRGFTLFSLVPSAAHLNRAAVAGSELVGIAWYRIREAF